MNKNMKIEQQSNEDIIIIAVHGRLIGENEIQELYSHFHYLKDQNILRVVLNLQYLDWLGSIGLGALISCATTMRKAGGDIRLCNLNSKLESLVSLTQLDHVFQIFDTVDLAAQSFDIIQH